MDFRTGVDLGSNYIVVKNSRKAGQFHALNARIPSFLILLSVQKGLKTDWKRREY